MQSTTIVTWAFAVAATAGCATPLPPVPAGPTPIAAPATSPPPRPSLAAVKRDLGGPDGVIALCEALRDEDGIDFGGNVVERESAREEQGKRREQAAEGTYTVVVPARGYAFRGYDPEGHRLAIDAARNFVIADGIELAPTDRKAAVAFDLPGETAQRALESQAAGELALALAFQPVRPELRKDGCVRLSGGRVVKLPVEVLAYALVRPDGTTIARGHTPDYVDEAPVASPLVSAGRPRGAQGREVPEAVASAARELGPTFLPCYRKALESRPNLRGTLVIDVRVRPDGRIESPRMQVSSLGDQTLVACAVSRAAQARLPGAGATRLSLPFSFGGESDR
jgi:hypothetical protein